MHPFGPRPLALLVGVLFLGLLVRMLLRGSISTKLGVVRRAESPVAFWIVAGANALIVLAALLLGLGLTPG